MNDMIKITVLICMAFTVGIISYIAEAVCLSKVAAKCRRNPTAAWIPILNYFLIRDIAGKKSHWQWLAVFVGMFFLGSKITSWLGLQGLIWCSLVWYWSAFSTIMNRRTTLSGAWLVAAIFFIPAKIYVMYKMSK